MAILTSLAAQVTDTGITAPDLNDILDTLISWFQGIYGSDVYLGSDSQDGQWLGILAQSIYDVNAMAVAVYNQFSPATAIGAGLSSVVKINGLRRQQSSNSTAPIDIIGQAGVQINLGVIGDNAGLNTTWSLPGTVTIPTSGSISVTATCTTTGAITASANTLTQILTPTPGWQTANNPEAASTGTPVEQDPTLRQRQAISTNLPALTPFDAIIAALENTSGVTDVGGYVNNTSTPDVNGVPSHGIALVVEGGAIQDIVNAIGLKKTPGPPTFGNTSGTYVSVYGIPEDIEFSIPNQDTISVIVNLTPLTGYTTAVGVEIQNSVATYINSLGLTLGQSSGNPIRLTRLYPPALLQWSGYTPTNANDPNTFEVDSLEIGIYPATPGTIDVPIAWNALPVCVATNNVTIVA